jgi:hypothetical protein
MAGVTTDMLKIHARRWTLMMAASALIACSAAGDPKSSRNPDFGLGGTGATAGAAGAAGTMPMGGLGIDNPDDVPTFVPTGGASGTGGAMGECGAVTQMAENKLQPVDIIFGIDTSGSMSEEVAQVQQNLNAFSEQIIASGIDVRVIMLASFQGLGAVSGGTAVDGPCIAPPLGSGTCPDDSNPPTYVHLVQPVASWDVLDVYINAYPNYRPHLRENSLKTFVTISDDNADSETSPFGPLGVRPTHHDADQFIAAVEALEPGSPMWTMWRYSGIYSFTLCPSAQFGAIGVVHEDLVMRTGGVAGDLCLQEFAPVFDALAEQVVEAAVLACDWDIPASPPGGGTFDPSKTNVQLTLDGAAEPLFKVPDASACGDREGWHYDDETSPAQVVACPATCTRLQNVAQAQVDLLFGCETILVE